MTEKTQGFVGDAATEKGGCTATVFLSNGTLKNGVIKSTPGQLYGLSADNINAAPCYVRLYNQTTAPATTDTPVYRLRVPGSTSGGVREKVWTKGLEFSVGIAYRITTGVADNDDTATANTEVLANFDKA